MGNDRRKSNISRREEKGYGSRDRREDIEERASYTVEKRRDLERDTRKEHHVRGLERNDRESDRVREKDRVTEKHNEREKESKKEKRIEQDESYKRESASAVSQQSTSQIKELIQEMREQRLKRKSESVSKVLSWVHKSRKLEERKYSEKEKAIQDLQEQEEGESEDDAPAAHTSKDLAGIKVLHGLDKVAEGGAVVLTLKDQSMLAGGDLNEETDMLENVEIGEQKRRDDAHKAAKKRTGKYEDMFDDGTVSAKKILPQYDDPVEDEGVTFDESGHLNGDADKKLEDLHKRPQGVSTTSRLESLVTSVKTSSHYYTPEEMLQFNKTKKQKSLRKKDKLDVDALEKEAVSAGLGVGDRGSRKDGKMQSAKEEQLRSEAQKRSDAYKSAKVKAEEACKALQHEQVSIFPVNEAENLVFGDEDDDLYKSIEMVRKQALRKQNDATGAQAIASAITAISQDDRVVFSETEGFVSGLHLDEQTHKPEGEDIIMEEDEILKYSDQEIKEVASAGLVEAKDANEDGRLVNEEKHKIVPAAIFQEAAVVKGLSGALQLLRQRGTLETEELDGRNMKKKLKNEYNALCHAFHGKHPGKKKTENRLKKVQVEMKLKQIGNVKSGQTSDPRIGFTT
ncbi:hypothetical protein MKW94_026342, partial [Papaver nudicaule]|nr:hypothetical protein [Papaver nudicaule]